jgi:hypothetical protein
MSPKNKIRCVVATALVVGAWSTAAALAAPEWQQKGVTIKAKTISFKGEVKKVANFAKLTDEANKSTVVTCTSASMSGDLEPPNKAEAVTLKLTECEGTSTEGGPCKVKTPSAAAGEVSATALEGQLGEVEKAEAGEERGLVLKGSKEPITTVEGTCIPKFEIKGAVIGELTKVKRERPFINLIYLVSAAKQKIRHFKGGSNEVLSDGVNEITFKTETELEMEVSAQKILPCSQVETTKAEIEVT